MGARPRFAVICAAAVSLLLSACAVVQYPSGETEIVPFNHPAFNVQGRHWFDHPEYGAPGMRCTTVVPDGSTGRIHVDITSDSSHLFATADYWVPTYYGQPYPLGTGEISVKRVDLGDPDPNKQFFGTFERKHLRSEATCEWGGWATPFWWGGTADLAFAPGQGPDWPTYDELRTWCLAEFGDEPLYPSGIPRYEYFCPWEVALPPT